MEEEFIEPKLVSEGMKQGLARMYSDPFMRDYLKNAIAVAKSNSLTYLKVKKYDQASDSLSRAIALQGLLDKGKQNFTYFESKGDKNPLETLSAVEETKL